MHEEGIVCPNFGNASVQIGLHSVAEAAALVERGVSAVRDKGKVGEGDCIAIEPVPALLLSVWDRAQLVEQAFAMDRVKNELGGRDPTDQREVPNG